MYNIGDGWSSCGDGRAHWEDGGEGWGTRGGWQDWGGERNSSWYGGPAAADAHAQRTWGQHGDDADGMDTADVQVPKWMRREAAKSNDYGARSWTKWRRTSEEGDALQGGALEEAGAGGSQGLGGGGPSEQTQPSQQQDQQGGNHGPAGAAGGGDAGADEEALTARREEILKQATTDGVDISAAAISRMGREELEAWAKDNLL